MATKELLFGNEVVFCKDGKIVHEKLTMPLHIQKQTKQLGKRSTRRGFVPTTVFAPPAQTVGQRHRARARLCMFNAPEPGNMRSNVDGVSSVRQAVDWGGGGTRRSFTVAARFRRSRTEHVHVKK